jgi:HSP20 family protein
MTTQLAGVMEREIETELVTRGGEEIANRFSQVYDSVARRAFEIFESRGSSLGHDLEDWFRAESELLHPVPLKVTGSTDEFIVRAEVPGFSSKDIEVIVEPRYLAILGKRETKKEGENGEMIRSEWCADRIFRTLNLPSDVDTTKVSTTLKDGILTVDLPKAQNTKKEHVKSKAD